MPHRTAIVVDDEPSVRKYITAILRRDDFQTVEAANGVRGLEMVHNHREKLDVVVTDIQMPEGDGLTFAHAVRQAFPGIPIILVSACDEPATRFDGFVQKPFDPRAIRDAVQVALALRIGPAR